MDAARHVTPHSPRLNEADIREALVLLDAELGRRGIRGEVCLFGGEVMVLAYPARQSTKDVDAVLVPTGPIHEAAAHLASERGWEPDWIDHGFEGWLSTRQHLADAGLQFTHLAVLMPAPEYLLAMRCMAAQGEHSSRDLADVKFLAKALRLSDAATALHLVGSYYPGGQVSARTQGFIKAAFGGPAAARSQSTP